MFGQFFESIYTNISYTYNVIVNTLSENSDCCLDMFNIKKISRNDYHMAVKKLKPKKAAEPDVIPTYILKGCEDYLERPLLHIFNLSITNYYIVLFFA